MTSSPLDLVVAINPSASFGRGRAAGPAVVAALRAAGHRVTPLTAPSYAKLLELTEAALQARPDALVVVGGDGMVHLGTGLLAGSGIPLGIVPSGTGNDMARGLGIPVGDRDAAVRHLLDALGSEPRVIDTARIDHGDGRGAFACVLSAGFDAIVNERANRMRRPRGRSRYLLALLRELALLRPIEYRLVVDGVPETVRALLVAVGNNTSLGGGSMRVVPDALLDDGLLDLFVVAPMSRLAFLRIFPRVFSGRHTSDPRVSIRRARQIAIEADAVVAYADGERIGPLPVTIAVRPASLAVLAPVPEAAHEVVPETAPAAEATPGPARETVPGVAD